MVNDAPEVYDLWKPQNYEKQAFRGPVRLRTAFADSINTVAIRLLADVGLPPVIDLATRAGITTPMPNDVGLSLALGTNSGHPARAGQRLRHLRRRRRARALADGDGGRTTSRCPRPSSRRRR